MIPEEPLIRVLQHNAVTGLHFVEHGLRRTLHLCGRAPPINPTSKPGYNSLVKASSFLHAYDGKTEKLIETTEQNLAINEGAQVYPRIFV